MEALVIGGNGFLGSRLVSRLRSQGHRVGVLDRMPARTDFDWTDVDYREGGLDDAPVLAEALAGVSVVYHLASSTVPSTSNADPQRDVRENLIGSLRLVDAMGQAGIRRLVFFSSGGTVYGNPQVCPVPEGHGLNPISSYGVVKVAIENYLMMYQRLGTLDPLILRPSNPYGPGQSTAGIQGAVAAFLGRAARGEGVQIWGDGEIVRDYIYVDDLVTLAIKAGASGETGVFNAGSGVGHSLNELCAMIREVTGQPLPVEYLPGRKFDVDQIVLDTQAASRAFSWTPDVTLREGLRIAWEAMQSKNT